MPALLFGSISTIADTSELQRQAFNDAFREHGLDWTWDQDEYRALLESSGGQDRVAEYARSKGEDVDAAAVHQTKSERYQRALAEADLRPREGVVDTIKAAKDEGYKVAFVTTTAPENVTALLRAVSAELPRDGFDLIVDKTDVEQPKPDGAAYDYALEQLGVNASDSVAVEDNLGGVQATRAAGVAVIAFPNANTAAHDFGQADRVAERLSFEDVQSVAAA